MLGLITVQKLAKGRKQHKREETNNYTMHEHTTAKISYKRASEETPPLEGQPVALNRNNLSLG